MKSYVPPHRRNNRPKSIDKKDDLKYLSKQKDSSSDNLKTIKFVDGEFPELINKNLTLNEGISIEKELNEGQKVEKSYAEITYEKENEEFLDKQDEIKEGWSIIEKNTDSNVVILDSMKIKKDRENLKQIEQMKKNNQYFNLRNKMIVNWNEFRDNENELLGDRSPYYNYKEEIEQLIIEDLEIERAIEEYNNQIEVNSDIDDLE
tara:strand:+ start:2466 stop:3080 length:615 start_codon:yes stop_codon:yes gene_type:complete